MSWEFWVFLVLTIITAVFFLMQEGLNNGDYGYGVVSLTTGAMAFIMLLASVIYLVPVKNIGIVTTANAPTGRVTGTGLKFVWPWQKVEDFDASIQPAKHLGSWGEGCTVVRTGSLATACVENRVQWQVRDNVAPKLFSDYKGSFDNMRDNYVEAHIQDALNDVFSDYNPLAQIDVKTGEINFDGAVLAQKVFDKLNKSIGSDIEIISVIIPLVHHDEKTEENIKAFQDVVAQARILEQREANAIKEKLVSEALSEVLNEEYLINKCIEASINMGVPPGLCLIDSTIINTTK